MFERELDETRCKELVHEGGRGVSFHQCYHKLKKDGYCGIHHPDAVLKRDIAQKKRRDEKEKNSVWTRLRNVLTENSKLKREVAQLKTQLETHTRSRAEGGHNSKRKITKTQQRKMQAARKKS